jgi:CheY-like chemotaxis protein
MPKPVHLAAIVEDDEIHTFIIKSLMAAQQFAEQTITFSQGQEALDYLSVHGHALDQLPDVIILDITMPVMDAWEFLDHFKNIKGSLSKKIPIYVLTTSIFESDEHKATAYPEVAGFIVKPLRGEHLDYIAAELQSHIE